MESEDATVLYVRTVDALLPERNDATVSPTPPTHLPVPSETFSPMPLTHLLETAPSICETKLLTDTCSSAIHLFPSLMLAPPPTLPLLPKSPSALHEKSYAHVEVDVDNVLVQCELTCVEMEVKNGKF